MKIVAGFFGLGLSQGYYPAETYPAETYPADPYPAAGSYDSYNYGTCGPTAEQGGAFWPSQSADDTCGVQFWSQQVKANAKCHLQLTAGFSKFLTLGGVFVTSPASDYYAQDFYFHTYDNWQGNSGVSVVNFWQNDNFPSNSSCYNADSVCVTCTEEPDLDYDGKPDTVQGVYLGNFMHDFRHASPSSVNVPIANSNGHINGTVYDIRLYDQYGAGVPITNIASHYPSLGHTIEAPQYPDGTYYSADGSFKLHVGCETFLGQFLYFSFSHETEQEANGWYSFVTADYSNSPMSDAQCPERVNWESAASQAAASEYAAEQYPANNYPADPYPANPAYPPYPNKNKNKNNKKKGQRGFALNETEYNDYADYVEGDYNYGY